ncbi:hypothetical protein KKF34_18680 [Myxococcota bacterium]|nr:hypothetical protein [Myxococcota bacterium]MBU1380778.1 hypothetical protein [Myxococcota bacterium]MBU1498912.1 hypothetical protein [Myxococcota bacterium]
MVILLILGIILFPAVSNGQTITVSLDADALGRLIENNTPDSIPLYGPFYLSNIKVDSIESDVVKGKVQLDFRGSMKIPLPFFKTRTIDVDTGIPLGITFKVRANRTEIFIPVDSLTFKTGPLGVSLKNRLMTLFRSWMSSSSGRSSLQSSLTWDMGKTLRTIFGKGKWKLQISQKKDLITLLAKLP